MTAGTGRDASPDERMLRLRRHVTTVLAGVRRSPESGRHDTTNDHRRRARRRRLAPCRMARARRPARRLFTAGYWIDLARTAERGRLDFLTIEDALGLQSATFGTRRPHRPGARPARRPAHRVLSRPRRSRIGLVPTVTTTHTEPFHVATAIATLDHVSRGRAGWRVQVSGGATRRATSVAAAVPPLDRRDLRAVDAALVARAVRRGRRRRRGRPPPLGQLGGRRDHPRRRHRPVRRPRQAALRRLRGRALLREGPLDHPALAAGPAARRRARAPDDPVRARRDAAPTSSSSRRTTTSRRGRSSARCATPRRRVGRERPTAAVLADVVVLLEATPARPRRARAARRRWPARRATSDALSSPARPRRSSSRSRRGPALGVDGVRLRPARLPRDLDQSPSACVPGSAPRRVPHGYAARHPARAPRPRRAPPTATPR